MASKAEKELRVQRVHEMLVQGFTRRQILQFVAEKTDWGVQDRTVDYYIKWATDQIREQAETNKDFELGRALDRLDDLYRRDMAIQDYKAALQVQKERAALLGLYEPAKVDNQGKITIEWKYSENASNPDHDPETA